MMRTMILALAVLAAAPAHAQITLESGQAVTLEVSTSDEPRVTGTGHAELGAYDRAFVEKLRGAYPTGDKYIVGHTEAPPVAPGAVDVRFVVEGKESVLILENGYAEGIVYRASIFANGKWAATDVCLVAPGLRGYEHWPFAIDRIELRAIRRVAWAQGDPIPCV